MLLFSNRAYSATRIQTSSPLMCDKTTLMCTLAYAYLHTSCPLAMKTRLSSHLCGFENERVRASAPLVRHVSLLIQHLYTLVRTFIRTNIVPW